MVLDYGIVGFGNSGKSVANWCESQGYSYGIWDDQAAVHDRQWDRLPEASAARTWVISPGVPPAHALVTALRQAKVDITTDIGLFLRSNTPRVIGITGTNGKTTVTEMIVHILSGCHVDAAGFGNVGTSPLAAQTAHDLVVLELSSFQLFYSEPLPVEIAVLTNLDADHLEWHRDFDEYRSAKQKLFTQARVAVVDGENRGLVPAGTPAIIAGARGAEHIWLEDGQVVTGWRDGAAYEAAWMASWSAHNILNGLMALAAVVESGLGMSVAIEALRDFRFGAHRQELVDVIDDVRWVNDSKGTNPHAVSAALRASDTPVVLLLGGVYKGGDFAQVVAENQDRLRAVIVYGRDRETIAAQLGHGQCEIVAGLQDAVLRARALAQNGDTVLLSPGCASFDEFRNYQDRGEKFRAWVRQP